MGDFHKALRAFHRRLMLRMTAYAALWGLLLALVLVIAAPWLRQSLGTPDYQLTLLLPALLPAAYVLAVWLRRPPLGTIVQAADAWSGNTGAVVAAHELAADSPFAQPVLQRAAALVRGAALPEPRPLRWALTALLVMLGLVPLSRWAHAQAQAEDEAMLETARKVDAPAAQAEALAREAGSVAETAKKLGASGQEKLADDIEQAAREAQAGGADKERALRQAHNLADRAGNQSEAQQARAEVRNELARNSDTAELARAIEAANPAAVEREVAKLADSAFGPDGTPVAERAEELLRAVENARAKAPSDAGLRRAAEALRRSMSPDALDNARRAREQLKSSLEQQGRTPEEIARALERIAQLDRKNLQQQLEEFAKQSSPLRDLQMDPAALEAMLEAVKDMKLSPEQAAEMARQARELSNRLELNADALREMLQQGGNFEGLEELARRMAENAAQEGRTPSPEEIPSWARNAMNPGAPRGSEAGSQGQPGGEAGGKETGGAEGGTSGDVGTAPLGKEGTKPVDGQTARQDVDVTDTGKGPRSEKGEEQRLDTDKAADERANRATSGATGTGQGVNTRDEEERLPRRYREIARKYFER